MSEKESNKEEKEVHNFWALGQESGKEHFKMSENYYKQNLKTLDEYLHNKFDYEIYEQLTEKNSRFFEVFNEPLLDFFQLLYQQVYFIESNKTKPLLVSTNLKQLSLTDEQFDFLFEKILDYFRQIRKSDNQIDICCREISKLHNSKREKLSSTKTPKPGNGGDPKPAGYASKGIEEKDLDDYLDNELNLIIYQDLIEGDNKDVFHNPVEFFQLFEAQVNFIGANIWKPNTIIKNLRQLPITEKQRHFLLYYLNYLLGKVDDGNPTGQMKICQRLIETELNKLAEKLSPDTEIQSEIIKNAENYFQFDFVLVKEFLKTLEGYDVKISYLIEAKTEYEQQKTEFNFESNKFDEKCELEINKFTRLKQFNVEDGQANNIIREHKGKILKTHDDLTKDRAILFMDYLLNKAGASSFKTAKAEAIFFLTGFDEEAVRQRLSSIYTNKDKKDSTYKEDLRKVRNLFNKLGLSEIVKKIDDDLERL